MFQQNLEKYKIKIAVFNCKTSKIEDILMFLESFKNQIFDFEKYKAYLLEI